MLYSRRKRHSPHDNRAGLRSCLFFARPTFLHLDSHNHVQDIIVIQTYQEAFMLGYTSAASCFADWEKEIAEWHTVTRGIELTNAHRDFLLCELHKVALRCPVAQCHKHQRAFAKGLGMGIQHQLETIAALLPEYWKALESKELPRAVDCF